MSQKHKSAYRRAIDKRIGANLKALRQRLTGDDTQRYVARRLGVAQSTQMRREQGSVSITIADLFTYCRVLRTSADQILKKPSQDHAPPL